jgi:hypothetical protein
MITNKGIELLGKYIVGQIPTFASHIAIGCGEQSLLSAASLADYSEKEALTFEMARVAIISRTVSSEDNGDTYAIFTAEVPGLDRYAITEVGVYPAEENNVVGSIPSKTLFSFSDAEDWQTHNTTTAELEEVLIVDNIADENGNIDTALSVFRLASDNSIFGSDYRLNRQEQPRFLNTAIAISGDYTALSGINLDYTKNHIELNTGIDLSELDQANEVVDKIKVAFSIIPTDVDTPVTPGTYDNDPATSGTQVTIEFATADTGGEYARMVMKPSVSSNNRYVVEESLLKDIAKSSSAFRWSDVAYVKIYANIDNATDNYLVLDGIRFENLSEIDNQFGLVAYTVIVNSDTEQLNERPIVKIENTTSYIEFKFKVGLT